MSQSSAPVLAAIEYIDTAAALQEFCAAAGKHDWIAVDTEFIREKTYFPKLCLIQVGVPGRCACIDPLALESLQPFYDLLFDASITKVMHACSQDQEIFVHLSGQVPRPIFDTQLAAPLLGLSEQMGYANFVREILAVSLDKAQSRTDWSRRPLSAAQIKYAADDVRYLCQAFPLVRERLASHGRLEWLRAEFEPYEELARYQPDPAGAWQRLRGLEKLRPRALGIAQQLAQWREQQALAKNLPRSWVLKDDAIVDIARLAPETVAALTDIRSLPARTAQRYGEELIAQIRLGMENPPQPVKARGRRAKTQVADEALADLLQAQLRLLADAHDINSATVGARKDLLALIREEPTPLLKGWRRVIAGDELVALRDGQRRIRIHQRKIEIEPTQ